MRRVFRLALLLPVFLLSACASAPGTKAAAKAPPTKGAVAFRLKSETAGHVAGDLADATIIIRPAAGNPGLIEVLRPEVSSDIYTVTLKPGIYEFSELRNAQGSAKLNHKSMGTFTVEAGVVTYLGTVQVLTYSYGVTPKLQALMPVTGTRVLLAHQGSAVSMDEGRRLLRRRQSSLANAPMRGWDEHSYNAAQMQALYRLVRSLGSHTVALDLGQDGVLFGTDKGEVQRVSREGRLERFDIGSLDRINLLAAQPDGTLVTVADEGVFRFSRDRGQTWQNVQHKLPRGRVVDLVAGADGTLYLVHSTLQRPVTHTVYKGNPDTPEWTALSAYTTKGFTRAPQHLFLAGNRLVLQQSEKGFRVIDPATGETVERSKPGTGVIGLWDDGRLFCRCETKTSRNGLAYFTSSDHGQTWVMTTIPSDFRRVSMRNATHGFGLRVHNTFAEAFELQQDGAWKKVEEYLYHLPLLVTRDGAVYREDGEGNIFVSTDNGRHWAGIE